MRTLEKIAIVGAAALAFLGFSIPAGAEEVRPVNIPATQSIRGQSSFNIFLPTKQGGINFGMTDSGDGTNTGGVNRQTGWNVQIYGQNFNTSAGQNTWQTPYSTQDSQYNNWNVNIYTTNGSIPIGANTSIQTQTQSLDMHVQTQIDDIERTSFGGSPEINYNNKIARLQETMRLHRAEGDPMQLFHRALGNTYTNLAGTISDIERDKKLGYYRSALSEFQTYESTRVQTNPLHPSEQGSINYLITEINRLSSIYRPINSTQQSVLNTTAPQTDYNCGGFQVRINHQK